VPEGRGWEAVENASTDWNAGVSSVSECFTFLVSPQRDPPSGRSRALRAPCFLLILSMESTLHFPAPSRRNMPVTLCLLLPLAMALQRSE
jgi:hypothetical protein